MKLSEALTAIEDFYIPGCVSWWEKQPDDLWGRAHDEFEKYIASSPAKEDLEIHILGWLDALRECVEIYSKKSTPTKTDFNDTVILGPEKLTKWESLFTKCCYVCETRDDLILEESLENKNLVLVVCKTHKGLQ